MSAEREFAIYLNDGTMRTFSAASLRLALRRAEKEIGKLEIIAACDRQCLPNPTVGAEQPFYAVLVQNRNFIPPKL